MLLLEYINNAIKGKKLANKNEEFEILGIAVRTSRVNDNDLTIVYKDGESLKEQYMDELLLSKDYRVEEK